MLGALRVASRVTVVTRPIYLRHCHHSRVTSAGGCSEQMVVVVNMLTGIARLIRFHTSRSIVRTLHPSSRDSTTTTTSITTIITALR